MAIHEFELKTSIQTVNIGTDTVVNAETYNGSIPGPTLELEVGDTAIVRLINDLPHPTGIHWHGIELHNSADGTPVTQAAVPGGVIQTLGNGVPAGGTYLYKFTVPRPGVFWYHPHHHHSTNRVFKGLYGMIVVTDPAAEAPLVASGVIPGATGTEQLVLSDITVCQAVNDTVTYVDPTTIPAADRPEWLSGATAQLGPSPQALCQVSPLDEDGNPGAPFGDGEVPNMQIAAPGRSVEGQTVLTNGVNVGGRSGTPANPGTLAAGAQTIDVQPGQGLRLQIANCAILRYFRLRLTLEDGTQVPLIRIGGEGGLLDAAIQEGGIVDGLDTRYDPGEILLPPSTRADVVAAIPAGASGVLTLWTRDFQRTGPSNPGNWAQLPTVPVLHLNVTGAPVTPYSLAPGTPLLSGVGAALVPLGAPAATLLDPLTFAPVKPGMQNQEIQLTAGGAAGINNVTGDFTGVTPYTDTPHLGSTRYAKDGDVLELTVNNTSSAHHPFHLHGFSFQPISFSPDGGVTEHLIPFTEFRDSLDVPAGHTLKFRVHISERELADGMTLGGALGRWLFHCHIFFHAHLGMIGELVITGPDGSGSERPYVDVGGSWAYAPSGGIATRRGTYDHPDGDSITLSASLGNVVDLGGGQWEWTLDTTGHPDQTTYVYITATDTSGRKDQAVFRLKIGAPDDGSDNGDPHIHTVDGKRYDFQAVGEFVLLRDRDGMEIQTRQTPVLTANPITDSYTGLKSCVSLNTAVAARVGSHRIAWQPGEREGQLHFYVDGEPAKLTRRGIDLDGNRVSGFDVDGVTALRVDYAHQALLIVTPHFWNSHQMWYLNVSVSRTHADEGLMGPIPKGTWLPRLASGATVGLMPGSLAERYQTLYKTFAGSWRVTDETSLFVYAGETSTDTFTDLDWPAGEPPCELQPQFEIPGAPVLAGMALEDARQICQLVTDAGLHRDCVFDVATTGDETFAESYRLSQEIRRRGTAVQVVYAGGGTLTAIAAPLARGGPTPAGQITFYLDDDVSGQTKEVDGAGRAIWTVAGLGQGTHRVRAAYAPGNGTGHYYPSSSPDVEFSVAADVEGPERGQGRGCRVHPRQVRFLLLLLFLLLWYWRKK